MGGGMGRVAWAAVIAAFAASCCCCGAASSELETAREDGGIAFSLKYDRKALAVEHRVRMQNAAMRAQTGAEARLEGMSKYEAVIRARLEGKKSMPSGAASVYGSITPLGAYYVTLEIGSPPQLVNVNLDTGSSVLAVPGVESRNASITSDLHVYAANASSTAKRMKCSDPQCKKCSAVDNSSCAFHTSYGDSSFFDGYIVRDTVKLSSLAANVTFGVATSFAPAPQLPVDGLIGLAYDEMACMPTCTKPLLDKLYKQHSISHDMFSICLERHSGGVLTLGAIDKTVRKEQLAINWVKMNDTTPKTFYTVPLRKHGVRFGKHELKLPSDVQYGIVDTGSTLLLMPEKVFAQIQDLVRSDKSLCSGHHAIAGLCDKHSWFNAFSCVYGISQKDIDRLPTLEFDLGGKSTEWTMRVSPAVYMLPMTTFNDNATYVRPRSEITPDQNGTVGYCVGLYPMMYPAWHGIGIIFGNTVMANKYITIYDRDHHRVGFADMGTHKCATDDVAPEAAAPPEYTSSGARGSKAKRLIKVGGAVLALLVVGAVAWTAFQRFVDRSRRQGYRTVEISA